MKRHNKMNLETKTKRVRVCDLRDLLFDYEYSEGII
jgi:hypothetical protein